VGRPKDGPNSWRWQAEPSKDAVLLKLIGLDREEISLANLSNLMKHG
jgi:hypothetical protein